MPQHRWCQVKTKTAQSQFFCWLCTEMKSASERRFINSDIEDEKGRGQSTQWSKQRKTTNWWRQNDTLFLNYL